MHLSTEDPQVLWLLDPCSVKVAFVMRLNAVVVQSNPRLLRLRQDVIGGNVGRILNRKIISVHSERENGRKSREARNLQEQVLGSGSVA